jgi:hypothetical protein
MMRKLADCCGFDGRGGGGGRTNQRPKIGLLRRVPVYLYKNGAGTFSQKNGTERQPWRDDEGNHQNDRPKT